MKNTKYPIILVHGIIIKDISFIKAFGGIEKHLRKCGYDVYTSQIDGLGSIKTNAKLLKSEILDIIASTGKEKVNIIAHSKGGLDSKRMIQEYGMEKHVASLTTLCTPHNGSPIATNIMRLPSPILKFIAFWMNFWYKLFGDKNPDALEVCKELMSSNSFIDEIMNIENAVYCQSYSSVLKHSKDDFVMGIPRLFYCYFEPVNNDGLVSTESSKFANYKGECINDSVSHTEIVDFMVKRKKREKIFAFYEMLCYDLSCMGF